MSKSDYQPISCDFYDELEAIATLKKTVLIKFNNEKEELTEVLTTITNLYTKNKEEFMEMGNDLTLRLDQLVEVDGKKVKLYC